MGDGEGQPVGIVRVRVRVLAQDDDLGVLVGAEREGIQDVGVAGEHPVTALLFLQQQVDDFVELLAAEEIKFGPVPGPHGITSKPKVMWALTLTIW